MTKKRRRFVHLHVMVTPEEQALIADRMAEAGISNMGAYMRKMALNGYVLHVDLSDIREIAALQKDYADLWEPLSELLKKLAAVVSL